MHIFFYTLAILQLVAMLWNPTRTEAHGHIDDAVMMGFGVTGAICQIAKKKLDRSWEND